MVTEGLGPAGFIPKDKSILKTSSSILSNLRPEEFLKYVSSLRISSSVQKSIFSAMMSLAIPSYVWSSVKWRNLIPSSLVRFFVALALRRNSTVSLLPFSACKIDHLKTSLKWSSSIPADNLAADCRLSEKRTTLVLVSFSFFIERMRESARI